MNQIDKPLVSLGVSVRFPKNCTHASILNEIRFIEEGLKYPARVTSIDEGIATIDFNHPLAGEDLTFEIKLLDVRE